MRGLMTALCVCTFVASAGADDSKTRLERIEEQVSALEQENKTLREQVKALSPAPAPVVIASASPAPAPSAAPSPEPAPAAAASPAPASTAAPAAPALPVADTGPKIKVGGQLRLRPEYRNRLKPDAAGKTADAFAGQRARASISVGTDRIQAYVEVQDARNWGTETSTVSNEGNADLHQAYLSLPDLAHKGISLTLGRQELIYGDERLLGALDWGTTARSFDGGVARYTWKGGSVDLLGALLNDRRTAARGAGDMVLSGAYGRFLREKPGRELDVYTFNLGDSERVAGEVAGRAPEASRITTVGARGRYAPATGLLGSAEAAFQFGHRGSDDHTAYALAVIGGYTFNTRFKPAVRLEWDRASGDANSTDGESREFNNLFPTNHLFYGYADLLGWRNTDSFRAGVALAPKAGQLLSVDYWRFRLLESRGAWKDAGGVLIGRDPTGNAGRDIGDELDLIYRLPVRKQLTLLLGYSAFFPGHFAETVRGKGTQSFGYASVLFKF